MEHTHAEGRNVSNPVFDMNTGTRSCNLLKPKKKGLWWTREGLVKYNL